MLREADVLPLPLENLPHFSGFSECDSDPEKKAFKNSQQLAPMGLLQALQCLYPNNTDVAAKLRIAVQSQVFGATTGKVNIWATANPERTHWLIDTSVKGLWASDLAPNVRLLVIPLDIVAKGVAAVGRIFRKRLVMATMSPKGNSVDAKVTYSQSASRSRIVFVTHEGLNYGDLFAKTLFYSDDPHSELYPENLLHFDYSGVPAPSEKLRWVCLGRQNDSWFSGISFALVALSKGILHVRSVQQILGLLILTRLYVRFRYYLKKLEAYPDLKIALIDYEILCPKALLLAFEARKIITVAVQERFCGGFYTSYATTMLSTYLCGSQYVADAMEKAPFYHVDHYLPVGLYRSDNFAMARQSPPPQILKAPIAQGRKIITALGYHTHSDWHNSQPSLHVSWTAHRQFLEEMIRLSREIPNVFIILRFKSVDWVSLPVFADVFREIESSENMTISMDYNKSFFSYDLCAYSHLVIAKHTSLGDECLAAGIPVLFHEYTHNTERLVADAFDYSPAQIMCFNYRELLGRSQTILSGTPHAMDRDYEYLKNVVYGGLGDGKVHERIHTHIDSMLT